MPTFNTDGYTDLNARGRQMRKARDTAEAEVWRLTDRGRHPVARTAPDSLNDVSNAERRSTVRRIVDYLCR